MKKASLPRITVITVCFNAENTIEDTFNSVRQQSEACEYIVIDGGSTDATVEKIKNNTDIINYWCSESDEGIADAMNKAINHATGTYVFFLNADDYFIDENSILKAKRALTSNVDLAVFGIMFDRNNSLTLHIPRSLNIYTLFKMPFCHQGMFVRTGLIKELGSFNTHLKICMDYDLVLRMRSRQVSAVYIGEAVAVMRDIGISSQRDWSSLYKRFTEERLVQEKNCHSGFLKVIYSIWWFIYLPYRRLRSKFELF